MNSRTETVSMYHLKGNHSALSACNIDLDCYAPISVRLSSLIIRVLAYSQNLAVFARNRTEARSRLCYRSCCLEKQARANPRVPGEQSSRQRPFRWFFFNPLPSIEIIDSVIEGAYKAENGSQIVIPELLRVTHSHNVGLSASRIANYALK